MISIEGEDCITARLRMRRFRETDTESLCHNINCIDVSKWLVMVPYPYSIADAKWWISETTRLWNETPVTHYCFAVEIIATGEVIGSCSFANVSNGSADVGYWIGVNYHGNGYGSEMLHALLEFGRRKLSLQRLRAIVFDGNTRSAHLLQRCGFERVETAEPLTVICKADGESKLASTYVYNYISNSRDV